MQAPPRDQVEAVLAEVVKEALSKGDSVHVPGLGTFSVHHVSSSMERTESGERRIRPPSDEVVFTQEP